MINEKEILISSDSYIRKDFYQVYPEILELVQKISERWNPQTSNESDPGVVLLKLLAFIADKNNYNIDKNVLECFMPSATQEDSMRKLCEMMGYEMSYYKSATTTVRVSYQGTFLGTTTEQSGEEIFLKAFKTYFTNEDEDVNYVLLDDVILTRKYEAREVRVIEGTLQTCYSNNAQDSELIKLANLDDNHRFYMPETMIAQNGIWVADSDASDNEFWEQVDNLNTQISGTKVWKFGYDSREGLPFIQFPDDISEIIGDGVRITYVRTAGVNGNISASSLTKLTTTTDYNGISLVDDDGVNSLIIKNESAATNGADKETIDQAYNNFKKTVGTFDTLVSCRDYANKIYQLVSSADNTTHLVSNCQVSDIRDDINRSASVMTFNSYGVSFDDISYKDAGGDDKIDHFDLYLYPFAEITGSYTIDSYKNSFLPTFATLDDIEENLKYYKTISHDIKVPEEGDICCIKNFYKLNAKITTTYKVNSVEEKAILNNVYTALYKNFNMRNIDFGEEIPYDSILKVIEQADVRIKNVSLDEPEFETKYTVLTGGTGVEHDLYENRDTYIRFLSKNILAGRASLLDYDNRFEFKYGDIPYGSPYNLTYGGGDTAQNQITKIDTETVITPPENLSYKLKQNEVLQFVAPNFATYLTYPAYVNYHFIWANPGSGTDARPAKVLKPAPWKSPTSASELNPANSNYSGPWYSRVLNPTPPAGTIHDDMYVYTLEDGPNKTISSDKEYVRLSSTSPVVVIGTAPAGQPTAENFNETGPWYRRESSGAGAGYLNDGSFRYIKVINYSASYEYFKLDDVGQDAIPPCINAGKEYKLNPGDCLYINYTDSNKNVFNIKYTYNEVITNGKVESKPDGVIIKPNFNLQNSSSYSPARSWSKTTGFNEDWRIAGMFALASDEQIELRDFVKSRLQTTTYCYWLIGDGHIPFTRDPQDSSQFSYILKEGEYFFYTDEAKASLVTLGSGTKLIRGGSDYPTTSINMYINYAATTEIDIDNVSNNGIGAFADDPWIALRFTEDDWLTVQEMRFITLTEGDELLGVTNLQSADGKIRNDFVELDGASYAIYGQPVETLAAIEVSNIKWQVRSRLDLNVGPNLKQKLSENQTITLYRTVQEVDSIMATITPIAGTDIYLKSNYLIQQNGGTGISTLITYLDSNQEETEDYPVTFILLSSGNALYDLYAKNASGSYVLSEQNKVLTTQTYDNNYTKVNFQTQRNIRLPLAIPSLSGENEEFGLIMIYYVPAAASASSTYAFVRSSVSNTIRRYNEYNTTTGAVSDYTTQITLKEGINIIQIKSSCTLTLTTPTNVAVLGNGTATFSKLSCINDKYSSDSEVAAARKVPTYSCNGVDVNRLALDYDATVTATDREFYKLLQDIRAVSYIDSSDIFYYNCDIDNSLLIDTDFTDPRVFYDYNNVYNKFVVSELDADYFKAGGISLTKASKIK